MHTPNYQQLSWPPNYVVRRSKKAKKVSLRIKPSIGLEIVLPRRATIAQGIELLNEHKEWVLKHLNYASTIYQNSVSQLPEKLNLALINKSWKIQYRNSFLQSKLQMSEIADTLLFSGEDLAINLITPLLKKWLQAKAKEFLPKLLKAVSLEFGLNYKSVSVRSQKTLWGSCSSNAKISLNYKLIFLPYELVRYVLIHELCHTIHLNHSEKFWASVEKLEKNYKYFDKELRHAENYVPQWLRFFH